MTRTLKTIGVLSLGLLLMASVSTIGQMGESSSQPVVFTATINAAQEVPTPAAETPAGGIGSGSLIYNPSEGTLKFAFSYRGLSDAAAAAHFHNGAPGTAGPVIQTICGAPEPAIVGDCPGASGFLQGTWEVPQEQVEALMQGDLYFNIHTPLNQPGELRGQITRQ